MCLLRVAAGSAADAELPFADRASFICSRPEEHCRCGIYGFFTVEELFRQYPQFAGHVIAVIAAEGMTTIGSKGLKTAAARIVAYWVRDDDDDIERCRAGCPGARRFYDLEIMCRLYGLNQKTREE